MRLLLPLLIAFTFVGTLSADTGAIPTAATAPSIATANPEYTNRSGRQNPLGVVALSDGYLVLWGDRPYIFDTQMTIFVSRVNAEGQLIDPTGIPVGIVRATSVTAVKEGEGARLYWTEYDEATASFRILTRTVSSDAVMSEVETVGSLPSGSPGGNMAAATNGTRTLIVFGRFVIVIDGSHLVRLTDLGGWGDPVTVAIAGDRALVTWTAAGGVLMYQILSLDGEILDAPGGSGLATGVNGAASASNGTTVLLAWSNGDSLLTMKRFDLHTGSISDAGSIAAAGQPLVIWNGSRFIVAWMNFSLGSLVGIDVPSPGQPVPAPRVLVRNSGFSNWAAAGDRIIIVDQRGFCIRASCEYDVWYSILPLDASSPAETSTLVSAVARRQYDVEVAPLGAKYFAVWTESPGGVYGAVVDRGAPSIPSRITLGVEWMPFALVSAGDRALFLTLGTSSSSDFHLAGLFFDVNGNLAGTIPQVGIGNGAAGMLSASWSGSSFLVVWQYLNNDIVGIRLGADGHAIDAAPFVIATREAGISDVETAFDGRDFIVLWTDAQGDESSPAYSIRSARVSPAGSVVPVTEAVSGELMIDARVACNSGDCLLTWTQFSREPSQADVRGLLLRNGQPDYGPFTIAGTADSEMSSRVSWEGRAFFITWVTLLNDGANNELRAASLVPGSPPTLSQAIVVRALVDASASSSALSCVPSDGCLSLFGALVDDRLHGQSDRLMKSFLVKARERSVRRAMP